MGLAKSNAWFYEGMHAPGIFHEVRYEIYMSNQSLVKINVPRVWG